jgi:hypothetical protein
MWSSNILKNYINPVPFLGYILYPDIAKTTRVTYSELHLRALLAVGEEWHDMKLNGSATPFPWRETREAWPKSNPTNIQDKT